MCGGSPVPIPFRDYVSAIVWRRENCSSRRSQVDPTCAQYGARSTVAAINRPLIKWPEKTSGTRGKPRSVVGPNSLDDDG